MKIHITIILMFWFIALTTQAQIGQLEKRDTVFVSASNVTVHAETGRFRVPENRQQKTSRLIDIRFVRLKSLASSSGITLVYLEGGSNPCTWQAEDPDYLEDWLPHLQRYDVILIDQRGTNDESLLWIWDGLYPQDFLVSEQAAGDHIRFMSLQALPAFSERGVDVAGYTMLENAKDIDALTKALKIDRYSILGFSNGTQLGLALIKYFGDHIANAVLAGVDGLQDSFNYPSYMDRHVQKLTQMVSRDTAINSSIPDLTLLLKRVMAKLEKQPVEIQIINPLTEQPMNVRVGAFGLALVLRLDMDDATDIPVIPRMLYALDNGNTSILKWFIQKRVVFAFAVTGSGLTQGIASGASVERWQQIEKEARESMFKNVMNFPFADVKDTWPVASLQKDFSEPVKSNVRTLFLSGDLDCRTPPAQAEEIRKGFSKSVHVIVKNAGHEQILTHPEIQKAIPLFLSGKDPGDMQASYPPITFISVTSDQASHRSLRK